MVVYIEYVIFDNVVLSTILVLCTNYLLKLKLNKNMMAFNILFHASCSIVVVLCNINLIGCLIFKISQIILLTLFSGRKNNLSHYFVVTTTYFSVQGCLAGVCFFSLKFLDINYSIYNILINGYQFPISIFSIFFMFYFYLVVMCVKLLSKKYKLDNYFYDIKLVVNNKDYFLKGYLDSGNQVYYNNNPVVILSLSAFLSISSNKQLHNFMLDKNNKIQIKGISKNYQISSFTADKIEVYSKKGQSRIVENIIVGISNNCFNQSFDCLLHSEII